MDTDLHRTVSGSRLAGLTTSSSPTPSDPEPLDLAHMAADLARDGDRELTSFTSEELAAAAPESAEVPGLPEDAWLAGLDAGERRVALAAATRSLAARDLLTSTNGRGVVHGDLRIVHDLRAGAPTVVQGQAHGVLDGRRRRVRHLLCRTFPGLVLHLATVAGVHRAALRTEASAGLRLAGVVVDTAGIADAQVPAALPTALAGPARVRARRAIDAATTGLLVAAHHRLHDGRVASSRVGLWRTDVGPLLWVADPDHAGPHDPDAGTLHAVDAVIATAICVGLLIPALPQETT